MKLPAPLLPALVPALLLAHVVFGLARVPEQVVARRVREVADYRRQGAVAYTMHAAFLDGADAVAELLAATPPQAVIGIRGDRKGAMEFAAALLWPRLCRDVAALPAGATTVEDRPIAPQVLVGDGKRLRLEPR